jgi:hypothetical protein
MKLDQLEVLEKERATRIIGYVLSRKAGCASLHHYGAVLRSRLTDWKTASVFYIPEQMQQVDR